MAPIESDIRQFYREYAKNIESKNGAHRPIRFAWSGDKKKRPLIFVHGSPGEFEAWAHFLLDKNLQSQFHILSIDRPGYGGSSEKGSEKSLKKQADEVISLLHENESHLPAILVGHSYGGPVVVRAAIDHPELIGGLVIVAGSVDPSLEKTKWFQYPAKWWPIRVLIPNSLRVCNEEILALKGELQDMQPGWSHISSKTIVIQGLEDPLVDPKNTDFIEQHLKPESLLEVVRVPGLNHFVPWKRPDLILKAVEKVRNSLH